jgi:hypothetical protein
MRTEESRETRAEPEPAGDVRLHAGHAEVLPFVWAWDGDRWHGPEGSGRYEREPSQSPSRS